jgi:hypothetical protein
MNSLIQPKTTPPLLISLALLCFALSPWAQAVVPLPDGGYPNFTTAEGHNALFSLTTGVANTGVGWFSLFSNTDGSYNTGVGAGTLLFNVGDQTTGDGTQNTGVGAAALLFNTTGFSNTATGVTALLSNTTGHRNTAIGFGALSVNTTGGDNTANGVNALGNNTTGASNTATGRNALLNNTTGEDNTANGEHALFSNTIGNSNTAVGTAALNNTTGSNNTAFGVGAGTNVTTANNVIAIGTDGGNVNDSCFIGNIFGATASSGTAVFINSSGQLGTVTSSRRFKKEIKPIDSASESILRLQPVTFRYEQDIDPDGIPQFGLVAEEVEKVNPDLVVRDKEGKPYGVRYDQVNAMLLNEFLKEHRRNEEQHAAIRRLESNAAKQEATISELSKNVEVLTTQLKERAAQIQKVEAHIETSQPATRVVVENPSS